LAASAGGGAGHHNSMSPMSTPQTAVRLAGEDLRDHRHVCVLADGPDDAYKMLMPFIVDGFTDGDRAVHLIDPETRDEHIERLIASGIDVSTATASHQLEVLTWTESYMLGGRFDRSAQLSLLRHAVGEAAELGFRRTRLIGTTEWAVEAATARDLVAYEGRVDEVLRRLPDVFVCVYDINRHSARTIADVLGVHSVAVVGGVLRTSQTPDRGSARERLLAAASELFHSSGIQATGVDSLIAAAGVAKATFYRHFPAKDDLVVAWLRDPRTRWIDRLRAEVEASAGDAIGRIPRFFEAVADWLETEDFRGCPYLNTGVEITDPSHPARLVIGEYLREVEDYLESLLAAAGYRDSRRLAAELQTLTAGAISLAVARRDRAPALTARDAALTLLAGADRD
jgi:AcrR family transcriptional regulator